MRAFPTGATGVICARQTTRPSVANGVRAM